MLLRGRLPAVRSVFVARGGVAAQLAPFTTSTRLLLPRRESDKKPKGGKDHRSRNRDHKKDVNKDAEDFLKDVQSGNPWRNSPKGKWSYTWGDLKSDLEGKANKASQENQNSNKNNNENENDKENKNNDKKDKETKDKKDEKWKDEMPAGGREIEIKVTPIGIAATVGAVGMLIYLLTSGGEGTMHEVSWPEFRSQFLDKGLVERLTVVNRAYVKIDLRAEGNALGNKTLYLTIGSPESFEHKLDEAQTELGVPPNRRLPVNYMETTNYFGLVMGLLPVALTLGFFYWMSKKIGSAMSGGGLFGGAGKSKAKLFNKETDVKVKFDDVAGMGEAKEEIMEFVRFLKNPQKFERLGAKIPRGAILSGPPGTGKTLIAKATAGEAGVPFLSVSGSEFVEMFVGVGASRVRDLFAQARKMAPAIIFVDEIDAIGKKRGSGKFGGGNDERESTLNQLLVEMDGFSSSDHVIVLAGTNRQDVLDPALLRPGRFDRHIQIDPPDMEGRKQIFAVHLAKLTLSPEIKKDMDYVKGKLATLTPGFAGADIANCCNEAALIAARDNSDDVKFDHFERAIERVIAGIEKKSKVLNPEEKKTVAYHEAGHAVCGWFFEHADPLLKVSIVPRGKGALGYAQYLPADNKLTSRNQLKDRMAMALGGRVSEELHFPSVTSGAQDDFKKVTQMAKAMVTQYGMSDLVGNVFFQPRSDEQINKPFSEKTAKMIDDEVSRIIDEAYTQCKDMLESKRNEIELVAQELLTKEVLAREDMIRLLGARPFPEKNEAFDKYLSGTKKQDGEGEDHNGGDTKAAPQ